MVEKEPTSATVERCRIGRNGPMEDLDFEYLKRRARELLVEDELNQILEQVQAWHDEDR